MIIDLAGTEWVAFFRPHALNLAGLFTGNQHYPPWVFVFLRPLAMLPWWVGYLAIWALSLIVATHYLRTWWRVLLFAVSAPVMLTLLYSNIDVLLVSALMTPLGLALLIVSCKPQALVGWIARRWFAQGRLWQLLPLMTVFVVSLAVWGWWPAQLGTDALASNFSITWWWPWTVPLGLALLVTRSPGLWLVGSVLVTPYLQLYHLAPVLAYFYRRAGLVGAVVMSAVSWMVLVVMTQ